jgi:hypothetical protein
MDLDPAMYSYLDLLLDQYYTLFFSDFQDTRFSRFFAYHLL